MSDLTKLTAEELLSAVQPRSDIRITAKQEFKRRLERLEKCEALMLAMLDSYHVMKDYLFHDDDCPACKAELAARAALEAK